MTWEGEVTEDLGSTVGEVGRGGDITAGGGLAMAEDEERREAGEVMADDEERRTEGEVVEEAPGEATCGVPV